jgi:spermidine synthase
MNYIFLFIITVVGLSGVIAQILLLRELLISFYGNELTIGLVLGNWVLTEALGVFLIGRLIDKVKNKINVFIVLQIIFSLILGVSIYLSRAFKGLLSIPTGEALGLNLIFFTSLFIILPASFCHGALFSAGCKIYSLFKKESAVSIGRIYTYEMAGTILGGIIFTYLLIPHLNSFQIVFIISFINLLICLFLFRYIEGKKLKYSLIVSIMLILFLAGQLNNLQQLSINKQFKQGKVLDYRNSIYGNVAVTKQEEQYTFFYNGIPLITTPYPDITFVEEFGHLPLLFHHDPKDILIISAGAGGLINEVLKHPIRKIDYAELDPLIIKMLKEYSSRLTRHELSDEKVNIINLDGRFFLRTTRNQYDIVLIGLSSPSDLATNRLFTQEFFSLVKEKLRPDGILGLWLPGSLVYLSQELKDINACIINALKSNFDYLRIIPGDYNILLASRSQNIMWITSDIISRRILEQNIKTNILLPGYLEYRLNKRWLDWFTKSSVGATEKINQDLRPFAVFEMLIFWNKKLSPGLGNLLGALKNLTLKPIFIFIFFITILLFLIFRRSQRRKLLVSYSILSTGFYGMLISLTLIFAYQVFYGYLYYRIGLLVSIFMSGIALGSILMTLNLEKIKNALRLFIGLEVLIILFSFILGLAINALTYPAREIALVFPIMFIISGFLMGLEFTLASKIYLEKKERIGETSGVLYAADLIGGWFAGLLGGIVFLPLLGVFNTCMIIVIFKLSSLFLLCSLRPSKTL